MGRRFMTRKLLAEIVGPAGSGKSALSEVLSARDKTIRAGFGVWRLPSPLLILHAMLSLPHAFRLSRNYWREDEFKLMIRLSALQQLLGSRSVRNYKALVMDEGAIFALVKLRTFRRATNMSAHSFDATMHSLLNCWSGKLDAVIWLDAPDRVLVRRIRERDKPHRMKDRSDREIHEFLARYRRSYEQVISELAARRNGLQVIRLNTERDSPERIADQALAGIRL